MNGGIRRAYDGTFQPAIVPVDARLPENSHPPLPAVPLRASARAQEARRIGTGQGDAMARKLRGNEPVLIKAVLPHDAGPLLEGGETVQVQFASACGKVIATVPGTIVGLSPQPVQARPAARSRELQILVSREALQSVSDHFAAPVAHLPQTPSTFLPSKEIVLGTIWPGTSRVASVDCSEIIDEPGAKFR